MTNHANTISRTAYAMGMRAGAVRRFMKKADARLVQSSLLSVLPFPVRMGLMILLKLVIVLLIASLAISAAMIFLSLLVFAWLPLSSDTDPLPGIDEFTHPMHQYYYPELYDDYGSLK